MYRSKWLVSSVLRSPVIVRNYATQDPPLKPLYNPNEPTLTREPPHLSTPPAPLYPPDKPISTPSRDRRPVRFPRLPPRGTPEYSHNDQEDGSRPATGFLDKSSPPPHLLTLADLTPSQIAYFLKSAIVMKHVVNKISPLKIRKTLSGLTIALIFDKRSTRTRVASETAANQLGGAALFLGSSDIQLGVNESLLDTAKVVGSMTDGIMARVDSQDDIEVGAVSHSIRCRTGANV